MFNFLFENQEISKLSIMSNYQNYTDDTNSWKSIYGFSSMITETIKSKEKREKVSFYLINSMQVAFLKSFEVTSFLGYYVDEEKREIYINELFDTIMKGIKMRYKNLVSCFFQSLFSWVLVPLSLEYVCYQI